MINKISAIFALFGTVIIYFIDVSNGYKGDFLMTIVGGSVIFGFFFVITRFFFRSTEYGKNMVTRIKNRITLIEEQKKYNDKTKLYIDSKHQFQYLSKDRLLQLYEVYKIQGKEDMRRLALEEILVEKGIIDYSPMHEKLNNISNKFF